MIEKDEFLEIQYLIYNLVIETELTKKEKIEWNKCLSFFDVDLYKLLEIMYDNIIPFQKININSVSNKEIAQPFKETLFKNVKKNNSFIENNFLTILHRIKLACDIKLYELFDEHNVEYPELEKLNNKSLLFYNRHGFPRELKIVNFPSIRTFHLLERQKSSFNITILRTLLQNNESFLPKNIDKESFQIVFSIKKINSKFIPINWIGSIYELKKFINLLFEKKVIAEDINYYYTIIDCFLVKNEKIEYSQLLNPRGSNKRLKEIENAISKSILNF